MRKERQEEFASTQVLLFLFLSPQALHLAYSLPRAQRKTAAVPGASTRALVDSWET